MELILVAISVASLISNVVLVRHFTKSRVFLPATTEYLPYPQFEVKTDAADEEPVVESVSIPAAVPAVEDGSPWTNRSGIQQGVSAAPAPPIKSIPRPPLARPDGFVR